MKIGGEEEVDAIQDIMADDKLAISIRYVHDGGVHVSLLSIVRAISSTS